MYTALDPELKNHLIEALKTKLQEIEKSSSLIIKEIYSQIEQLENKLEKSLEKIDKDKKIIFDLMTEIFFTDKISKHKFDDIQAILSSKKTNGTQMEESSANEKPKEYLDIEWLWLFREQSKTLKTVNLNSLSESQKEVNLPELITSKISMCTLPNKNIFCYGNYEKQTKKYSGVTFTINDCNQNNIYMLTEGIPCISSGLVYYDEAVYSFGGRSITSLNLCQKYNLIEDIWEALKPLDASVSCCSCDILGNNIVYSGIGTGINTYTINLNLHSLVFPLQNSFSKIVFSTGKRVIVAENGGKMYESGDLDANSWNCIGNSQTPELEPAGYKLFYKNSIVFALAGSKLPIFQFSKDNKKITYLKINKQAENNQKDKEQTKEENKKQNKEQIKEENKKQNKEQTKEENKKQNKEQIKEENKKKNKEQTTEENKKKNKEQTKEENKKQNKQQNNAQNNQQDKQKNTEPKAKKIEEEKKNEVSKWKPIATNTLENNQQKGNQAIKDKDSSSGQNKGDHIEPQENKPNIQLSQEEIKSGMSKPSINLDVNLVQSTKAPKDKEKENKEDPQIQNPPMQLNQLIEENKKNEEDAKAKKREKNRRKRERRKEIKKSSSSKNKLYIFAEGNLEEYTKEALNLFEKEGATEVILRGYNMGIPSLIQVVEEIKASLDYLYQTNEFYNFRGYTDLEENCSDMEDEIAVVIKLSKAPLDSTHYGYQPPMKITAPLIINFDSLSSSDDSIDSIPNEYPEIEAPLIISSEPLPGIQNIQTYQDMMEPMDQGEIWNRLLNIINFL